MREDLVSDPAPKRRRAPLTAKKKLAFAAITFLVLFGIPEVVFQVRAAVREGRKPRLPLEPCPYRGNRLVPGARYERKDQGRKIDINSFGLRGPEITEEKPAGTTRVACIGGSTTFGLYASSNEATWPSVLERGLRQAGRKVEVLNGGAPGWSLRASLTNLELTVFPLSPDAIVCYHAYNDLMDNHTARYHADSHVDDVEQLRRDPGLNLVERSALLRFIRSRFRDPHDTFQAKKTALHPEGRPAFERNLRRLVRRAREQGARLLLCTFPWAFRETYEASRAANVPDLERWYMALGPLDYPVLLEGMRQYNETVRQVGAELGVPVLDLAVEVPNDVDLYVSPIHHSDAGEAIVAQKVADALAKHGLLP